MMRSRLSRGISLAATVTLLGALATGLASAQGPTAKAKPRGQVRVALLELDVAAGMEIESRDLTDQVQLALAELPKIEMVERQQLQLVADEHRIALAGLVDNRTALKLGGFVNADYIVVGRASRIGQSNFVILKVIDVRTSVQKTVAAKASAEDGIAPCLERLNAALQETMGSLATPHSSSPGDEALVKLKAQMGPLRKKVFLVAVAEEHVSRPLADPAAQQAIANRLRALGVEVIVPANPVAGWKQHLLTSGTYGKKQVDYLLEGEGVSGLGGVVQGLVTCRARVELRAIAVPGREVTAEDRDVAAAADLVEALAAKSALEQSGTRALDSVIQRLLKAEK